MLAKFSIDLLCGILFLDCYMPYVRSIFNICLDMKSYLGYLGIQLPWSWPLITSVMSEWFNGSHRSFWVTHCHLWLQESCLNWPSFITFAGLGRGCVVLLFSLYFWAQLGHLVFSWCSKTKRSPSITSSRSSTVSKAYLYSYFTACQTIKYVDKHFEYINERESRHLIEQTYTRTS